MFKFSDQYQTLGKCLDFAHGSGAAPFWFSPGYNTICRNKYAPLSNPVGWDGGERGPRNL